MAGIKKKKITIALISVAVIVALVGCIVGGLAIYSKVQTDKIPALSAKQALDYTLNDSDNGKITVGIIRDGVASYKVYGKDGVELPTENRDYEIGSLTKTFTASLVCKAVTEGKIALDSQIDTYLDLPDDRCYPTIKDLLTHTSGYKGYYYESPMTKNFFKGRNDFYGIGDSMIQKRLSKIEIEEGEHDFLYSNFGYATLGLILEKVYATEFSKLMNDFIKTDLPLTNTHMSNERDTLENKWDWLAGDTYMSAGALISNVEDMLLYANTQLNKSFCNGKNLKSLRKVDANTSKNKKMSIIIDEVAYGWMIDDETDIIWHNGGTGDYNSYLGLDLKNQLAVVVLSNLAPDYKIPATVIGIKTLIELKEAV